MSGSAAPDLLTVLLKQFGDGTILNPQISARSLAVHDPLKPTGPTPAPLCSAFRFGCEAGEQQEYD
jgi:hypothetical protein